MGIRECLQHVLDEYEGARLQDFARHPLAEFIRHDLWKAVVSSIDADLQLICKGSAGQGVWARGPWLGLFYPLATTGAQGGYYPVYLFREDMHGVYLSLNQGITEAKQIYKSDAKSGLRVQANTFRALLGAPPQKFPLTEIDLSPSSGSSNTAFYEAGNVYAAYYLKGSLPSEEVLRGDLHSMLSLYGRLYEGDTEQRTVSLVELDEPNDLQYEDATKFRMHKRIERNTALANAVKKKKGCICEVCNIDFSTIYGELGAGYIEAHHLRPLASMKGLKVQMDPRKDFAVLCSNCHRMVHRSGYITDIAAFKQKHYFGK